MFVSSSLSQRLTSELVCLCGAVCGLVSVVLVNPWDLLLLKKKLQTKEK